MILALGLVLNYSEFSVYYNETETETIVLTISFVISVVSKLVNGDNNYNYSGDTGNDSNKNEESQNDDSDTNNFKMR